MTEIHPARFSKRIIETIDTMLGDLPPHLVIHDPYAGSGERLGALCDGLGRTFSGTEIERPFIIDKRVKWGNSTKPATYPKHRFVIVTSPVYPNGMADDFKAKDASKRKTYRQARASIVGKDEPLAHDNMGKWGYRGTKRGGTSSKRQQYWRIARDVAQCWLMADAVILNVSDFISKDSGVEPLVNDWIEMLTSLGWKVRRDIAVVTPRMKNGSDESRDQRVEAERVILFTK